LRYRCFTCFAGGGEAGERANRVLGCTVSDDGGGEEASSATGGNPDPEAPPGNVPSDLVGVWRGFDESYELRARL
jgi:hypothetical protein